MGKMRVKVVTKKMLLMGALLGILTYHGIDYQYHPNIEILDQDDDAFARYSKGKIFIGSQDYLDKLKNVGEYDVLVLDEREGEDPDFKIYNSYLITDKEVRNEILEVLCKYEECYPSDWDRTIESMRLEWLMHNFSYVFNYETNRTTDVDLNNKDEEVYQNPLLRKIFKL